MKKHLLFTMLTAGFMTVSCNQQTQIIGNLDNFAADDSLLVMIGRDTDTIPAHNGQFTYVYNGDQMEVIRFFNFPKRNPDGSTQMIRTVKPINVVLFPKTTVHMSGNLEHPQISGGKFYDEYNKMIGPIEELKEEYINNSLSYTKKVKEGQFSTDEEQAYKEKQANLIKDINNKTEEYIASNLASSVSLYLLSTNKLPNGDKYLEAFSEELKVGATQNMYNDLKTFYEARAVRKQAAKLIKVGKEAPDFTLKDVNGKDFTLSSLRGKYVVLDFWGTWCGWCMKGIPAMKKMYETYKDRLEIVGIACRDKEDKWKKVVGEQEMIWTNVFTSEGSNAINNIYNVSMYPCKLILSPEGTILHIHVGESEDFYKKIDEYMK